MVAQAQMKVRFPIPFQTITSLVIVGKRWRKTYHSAQIFANGKLIGVTDIGENSENESAFVHDALEELSRWYGVKSPDECGFKSPMGWATAHGISLGSTCIEVSRKGDL